MIPAGLFAAAAHRGEVLLRRRPGHPARIPRLPSALIARQLPVLLAVLAVGCRHTPAPEHAASPRGVLPAEVAAYRPEHPGWGLEWTHVGWSGHHGEILRFSFNAYSSAESDVRRVEGTFYRTLRGPPGGRAPLLILAPILAGAVDNYLACRVFARWACAEGFSAFFVHQDEDVLTVDRDALRLEELARDNIKDNIRALDLLLGRPDVDPGRLGSLGISMGAIKNVVLAAVEPRLRANVFCLGGGNLPEIFGSSRERRVVRYVSSRLAWDGIALGDLQSEVDTFLRSEPLRWASSIAPERSLVFLGTLDDKVPYPQGLELWESLGEPQAYFFPLGHYTGMLAAPFAASRMWEYFHEMFGASSGP